MGDNVLYQLSPKREYYTTVLIIKWINEVVDIKSSDHMQISSFGSIFMKYDGIVLREEIESEAGKAGIDLYLCTENPVNCNHQCDFRRSVSIDEVAHSLHSR